MTTTVLLRQAPEFWTMFSVLPWNLNRIRRKCMMDKDEVA